MALSFNDDPSMLPYPGAVPAGYPSPVLSFDDPEQEALFQQAMEPQPIAPADPVPYPEPVAIAKQIPISQDAIVGRDTSRRVGETEAAPTTELARARELPPWSRPGSTGFAKWEFPGWDPYASEAEQERAFNEFNERQPGGRNAGLDTGGVTPEGDAGIEIDETPAERDVTAAAEAGDADFTIDALPTEEALPPPPTSTTPQNYLALNALARAPLDGTVDPERIAHAQRLLGWTDAEGRTARAPELPEEYQTDSEFNRTVAGESAQANFERQEREREKARLEEKQMRDDAAWNDARARDAANAVFDKAIADGRREREENRRAARELANQKLDRGRWWRSASTGQKVSAIIGALAGALLEARGGKNTAMPMLQKLIDDDVADQKAEMENKRLSLGEDARSIDQKLADADFDRREGEIRRQASYQVLNNEITSYMQNFNPRGAQAQRFREFQQGLQQAANQAEDKAQRDATDMKIKIGKHQLDVNKDSREERELQMKERKARASALAGGGAKLTPDEWVAYHNGNEAARPPFSMTTKDYDDWIKRQKGIKDLTTGGKTADDLRLAKANADKAESEAQAAKQGYTIHNPEGGKPLIMGDGKTPFTVLDVTERSKLRGMTAAAVNLRRLSDKIEALRKKTGGASKYLSPQDYKDLNSLAKQVDFEVFKAFDLGAPSEGDKEMSEGARGGDVTAWFSKPEMTLDGFAKSVEEKVNYHLGAAGYDGNYITFQRARDLPTAEEDYIDETGRKLVDALSYTPNQDSANPLERQQGKISAAITNQQTKETDELLTKLEAFATANPRPKDRARASEWLQQLANTAVNPDVKKKIRKIVETLPGRNERKDKAR